MRLVNTDSLYPNTGIVKSLFTAKIGLGVSSSLLKTLINILPEGFNIL